MQSASNNRQAWSRKEDEILCALAKKHGIGNWSLISEKMAVRANTGGRSGKQCRQRWHNHLDPDICKKEWTTAEERIMFESHKKYGNKWADISAKLNGRTDNDVKNHFYSTLRKSLRRINKILGLKNSTQKIKQIKPSVLSKIFDAKESMSAGKEISEALFKFSLENKSIEDMEKSTAEDKALYQRMIDCLNELSSQQKQNQSKRNGSANGAQEKAEKKNRIQRPSRIRKKKSLKDFVNEEGEEKEDEGRKVSFKKTKPISKKENPSKKQKKEKKGPRQNSSKKAQKGSGSQKIEEPVEMPQFNLSMKSHSNKAGKTSIKEDFLDNKSMVPERYVSKRSSSGRPQSSLLSLDRSLRSHRDSASFREDSMNEFCLNDLNLNKKSSSYNELKKLMSPWERGTIYVTPRNPSPAFGSGPFQNFRICDKSMLEQDINESTEKIRQEIAKNSQT